MKHYPEMQSLVRSDVDVYVFEKLDGSNIRAEWSPKRGFYKFGTRKRLLGEDDPQFGEAIGLIKQQEEVLGKIFKEQRYLGTVCYFEFLGNHSFAGLHEQEPHKAVLIDVEIYKEGFLSPNTFLKLFQHSVEIPKFIYYGKINSEVEAKIRAGLFQGASFEGVVCKAAPSKKWSLPIMFKVKNQAWIDKVKARYASNPNLLKEML